MKIINAENAIVGRIATRAAKYALLGEEVHVVNCEKAIISGSKPHLKESYVNKVHMGTPAKGPIMKRVPYMFVKRIIKGMLPYSKARGRDSLKLVKCYDLFPDRFKKEKVEVFEDADASKLKTLKYMTVKEICKIMGER